MRKCIALLLMICLLVTAAGAEDIAPHTYTLGRATFRLPADAFDLPAPWALTVTDTDGASYLRAENTDLLLDVEIAFVDYAGKEDVDALSDADIFTDSAAYMVAHAFDLYIDHAAETVATLFTDAGEAGYALSLPNGEKAKISGSEEDGVCYLTHYDDQAAFLITVSSPIHASAAVLTACEIANSLLLAAAPEAVEEPAADAEEAPAQQFVVVKNYNAKVRTEPNVKSKLIKTVFKGTTMPLLGESNGFYMVELNGQIGYIHSSTCELQ